MVIMANRQPRPLSRVWTITLVVLFIAGPALGASHVPWWLAGLALGVILICGTAIDRLAKRRDDDQHHAPR